MSLPRIGDRVGSYGGNEGLPPGYTRLEYLQSTGTQYIKTDFFVPADGLYLYADMQFVGPNDYTAGNETFFDYSNTSGSGVNFGSQENQRYDLYNWWGNYDVGAGYSAFAINSSFEVVNYRSIYEVKDLTVSYGPQQISILSNGRGVDSEVPFLIFGGYKNGTEEIQPFGRWNMRIYEMKLGLRDGNIVRHLVPALNKNGVACLYDLITGQCFYNNGKGYFLHDRLVNTDTYYMPLNYLVFSGREYIETGIFATNEIGAKIKATRTKANGNSDSNSGYLLACRSRSGGSGTDNYFMIPANAIAANEIVCGFGKRINISKNTPLNEVFESSINFKNDLLATWNGETLYTFNKEDYRSENYCKNPLILGSFVNDTLYPYTVSNWQGRIYYATITQGTEIVRNFIPAMDLAGIPCLYDKISKSFYYSNATFSEWG